MAEMRLVFFLCAYLVLECAVGQEVTNSLTESVTESSDWTRSHAVDWDTYSTATIPDKNQGKLVQNEASGYSLPFSDEWKSFLISQTPFGARLPQNRQLIPENFQTNSQNPATDPTDSVNVAVPEETYQQFVRNPIENPALNYPPFFYPAIFPPEPSGLNRQLIPSLSRVQNYSTPLVNPLFYDAPGREATEYLPPGNFPFPAYYFPTAQNLRDAENAVIPAAFPVPNLFYPFYPPAPNSNENSNVPTINVFVRPPLANPDGSSAVQQESAIALQHQLSKPNESDSGKEVRQPEIPISEESFPIETLPQVQSIPYGELPFPFGILPQGVIPPTPVLNAAVLPPAVQEIPPQKLPSTRIVPSEELFANPAPELLETEKIPTGSLPPKVPLEPNAQEDVPIPLIPKIEEQIDSSQYEFGFHMNDGNGSGQSRQEVSNGDGIVKGRYSYTDPFGMYRVVSYVADKNGFRAIVQSNEPGVANPGSADVMVIAEPPPPHALAEGAKKPELIPIVVPDEPVDLVAQGSEPKEQISKR